MTQQWRICLQAEDNADFNAEISGFKSSNQGDHLEKEIAIHSSILAWKIPWTEESMELQKIRYNLATKQQQGYSIQQESHQIWRVN